MAYKDMHTLYEAEQKRADRLTRGEATKELGNEENSDWVRRQLEETLARVRFGDGRRTLMASLRSTQAKSPFPEGQVEYVADQGIQGR